MIIKNIQKHTFIDYPGLVACTIFVAGCNFNCSFCHNTELLKIKGKSLSEKEILDFLKEKKKYLDGVCFTGGEPLLTINMGFLKKIKELDYKIKIDTNGSQPGRLKRLIDKNLVDYVAMDIKASSKNYNGITRSKVRLSSINKSIKLMSQLPDYEFRTTVIPTLHDVKEIKSIRDWLLKISGKKKLKAFYLQAFESEEKKLNSEKFEKIKKPSKKLLEEIKKEIKKDFEKCEIRI